MAAQRSSDKQAIGVVKTKHEEMKRVSLDVVSVNRLEKLDDEVHEMPVDMSQEDYQVNCTIDV